MSESAVCLPCCASHCHSNSADAAPGNTPTPLMRCSRKRQSSVSRRVPHGACHQAQTTGALVQRGRGGGRRSDPLEFARTCPTQEFVHPPTLRPAHQAWKSHCYHRDEHASHGLDATRKNRQRRIRARVGWHPDDPRQPLQRAPAAHPVLAAR